MTAIGRIMTPASFLQVRLPRLFTSTWRPGHNDLEDDDDLCEMSATTRLSLQVLRGQRWVLDRVGLGRCGLQISANPEPLKRFRRTNFAVYL